MQMWNNSEELKGAELPLKYLQLMFKNEVGNQER